MTISRREMLRQMLASLIGLSLPDKLLATQNNPLLRAVPASGENLPAIGMGTWLTYGIDQDNEQAILHRVKILSIFFSMGGRMIDSSPMYGTAEEIIGICLKKLPQQQGLFSASKVWTMGWQQGLRQMERSRNKWHITQFDLMQVHNLLDWKTHLPTLRKMKASGDIRYIGVTTSHGRRHDELEKILRTEKIDFVQLTYNLLDREAEQRLLPLAADKGIAVIVNRPYQGGKLFSHLQDKKPPDWAVEAGCTDWPQFFLKFIIAHPAITCTIPATRQPEHMKQNMASLYGELPDEKTRQKMIRYFQDLYAPA